MSSKPLTLFCFFVLALTACSGEVETAVTPTPLPATATTIPATVTTLSTAIALHPVTREPAMISPQPTVVPPTLELPTATPTAVPSPTPTIDETSSSWLSAVNTVTIYSGPGTEFAPAGTLEAGIAARRVGDSQQDWIPIECPAGDTDSCWVLWDYNALYPYEGSPLTLNIPDPASLQSDTDTTVSPDGRWQAQVTRSESVSLTSDWLLFFYVELKVTSLDGSTTWTPVSEWHAGGLGEEDAPQLFHWSMDGRYLYYTSRAYPDGACAFYDNIGDYLDRLDLSDGTVAALPPPLARGILALSPDETMMAYLSSQTLVVRDLATAYDASQASLKWQIPLDVTWPTQVSELVWSPDGQRILVTADHRIEGCDIAGRSSWELDITTGILTATSTFVPPAEPTPIPCPTSETQGDITRETFLIFCGGRDHVNIPRPADLILNIGNNWITSAHEDKGFKGYIDELRLSAIGRYDTDFEPQNQFTADEFTVGLWHFDEGQGTITADESGHENHGILTPFVRWGSQP